jgi:hypothetical protein
MTIEKTFQGAWKISTIHKGYLVTQQYFFYTKKEAIAEFKEYLKTL